MKLSDIDILTQHRDALKECATIKSTLGSQHGNYVGIQLVGQYGRDPYTIKPPLVHHCRQGILDAVTKQEEVIKAKMMLLGVEFDP